MDQFVVPLRLVLLFVVVLARIGGLMTFAPFWGNAAVTTRVRVVLALVLALAITPSVAPGIQTPPVNTLALAFVIVGEVLTGCALGLVGRLVFNSVEIAGQVLGYQLGFSLASTIDPETRVHTAALATIAQMTGLAVLLATDGHHWFLAAMVKSFYTNAPGTFTASPALAELLVRTSANMLATGVALAAPAIVVLLAAEFVIALAGRAVPQLQVMLLSFPVKIAVGLWLTGAALYFVPGALRTTFSAMKAGLSHTLGAL